VPEALEVPELEQVDQRLKKKAGSAAFPSYIACNRLSGSGNKPLSTSGTQTGRMRPLPSSILDQDAPTSNQIQGRLSDTGVMSTITALALRSFSLMFPSQSLPGATLARHARRKDIHPVGKDPGDLVV
jgi:hypothetical protein